MKPDRVMIELDEKRVGALGFYEILFFMQVD